MKKEKGLKIFKIIVSTLIGLLLIGIIFLNISFFVSQNMLRNNEKGIFSVYPLVAKAQSMVPVFKKGDLIFTKRTDVSQIKKGDIISFFNVYSRDKDIVTHRVVKVDKEQGILLFDTKGDANDSEDKYSVLDTNVIGVYMFRIPYLGHLVEFIQKPFGLVISLLIIALIYVAIILINHKQNKNIKEYKPGYDGSI